MGAGTIDDLIAEMGDMQARLDAVDDGRRHWHGVYRRGTIAVRDEIRRGGFADSAWLERWDLAFAAIYLEAMERWDRGQEPSGPWRVAFEATRDPAVPPLRHVLLGLNAHVNFDLPQALIAVISDDEWADPEMVRRRHADHKHIDDVLVVRVGTEDRQIAAAGRPGDRGLADRLLVPVNRAASKRFLKEARAKVYSNARLLSESRRQGPEALAARMAQLEELCRARVADLRAPGQVLLKLSLRGFGVALPADAPRLSHGLGAVQGLADDVGVTGVLGRLGDHVEQHPPRRPVCSRLEPRRLGQRVGRVQVRQRGDELIGPARHLLVAFQQAGQRLALRHDERPGPLAGVRAHRRRAVEDEAGPLAFGGRDVLDQAAQAQLAHRGALPGLVVGQAADGVAQEVAVLGEGGEQVGTLAGHRGLAAVHGRPLPFGIVSPYRTGGA